jgi:DNA polymerase elongation subunit (family B)
MSNVISQEIIESFLNGSDEEKYIVSVEYDYTTNKIYKILQDPEKGKVIKSDDFTSFLWVGDLSSLNFYSKSKAKQKEMMGRHGILIEKLNTGENERLEEGMTFLVKSIKSYTDLINFFKDGGIDPWHDKFKKYFTILSPVEQYLIQKKKRLFKGIEEYSDVHRYVFDIETTGLDPKNSKIILIGVKDNRGFKKTFDAFGDDGEKLCITNFFETLKELKPTIIGGYNSANFDFPFIIERCKILNLDINKLTSLINIKPLKEKESTLKLASEVEKYTQHVFWGFNTIDIAHSVRRAQAINSEIKKWSLKYITTYLEKEKPNRMYVKGDEISKIYLSGDKYYVNPKTGGYRKVDSPGTENLLGRFPNIYEIWDGKQIVEQYLDDDLYETMIVDDSFSQSTFLISKLVPTTYERVATMGTATLWKLIMLAWSYENNLALPKKGEKRKFTGGLSRLVRVGYSKDIVKFDFSSLYPSIQLVYDIFPECDIMGVQKSLLKYFRNVRIKYKHLAGEYKDKDIALSETYDRKQLPIKIFINGYFGSLSAPHVFPWGDINKGEEITCIGRQWLRGMVMFFMSKGYTPLVMDSVEYDTPIYLKDNDDNMVILPICDLFNDKSDYLSPDGLRDFEPKEYKVLTKNGWKNINYVYKHETNKPIHKLVTKDRLVSCTSDHSVFQNGEQIKPTELKRGDKIDIIELPKLSLIEFNEEYYVRFYIENLLNNNILNLIDDTFYFNNIQDKVKTAKICYYLHKFNLKYSLDSKAINSDEVWDNINEGEKNQFVYDISTEDGTFVGGIGGVLLKNTDGVNFETPKDISNRKYIGLGNNELVIKGKEYIGVDADTAEFNDIFMRNEMGLDIDYMSPVTINISRKNYIIKLIKKGKEKIKLTGNTIKSKKLAQYVIEFLDEGLKLLLNGDGVGFIELYYKHLTMIYNMDIPLNKIANKSRIKQTIEDYKEHIKKVTKGGSLMARQAHMELLLHNNITPSLGDTVYYINNGTKKSQGDVQKVANEKYSKKEETEYMINNGKPIPKTYRIELNCYLIDEKEMLENPDLKGSYNVTKYIEKFNKTIKPLMVVFHPDIRNEIIVEEPNKRGYFTQNQCDLVNGFPLEEKGQDDLNEILTLSESEINFWRSMNKDPYLMYLEDSINSIDSSWVDSNRELLNKTIENIEKHNDDDEIFSDDWLETPLNAFIIE